MLQIDILKAENGDCFRLRFVGQSGRMRNIMIDSGPRSFADGFCSLCDSVQQDGEMIDVLCITHQDDDHIGGVEKYLERKREVSVIRQLWMNGSATPTEGGSDVYLSARQRDHVLSLARAKGISIRNEILKGQVYDLDGMRITILSPAKELAEQAMVQNRKSGDRMLRARSDRSVPITKLQEQSIKGRDGSPSNRASIVMVLEYGGKRLLFTGDAPDEVFLPSSKQHFDMVKLPHHGSIRNLSEQWCDRIDCKLYCISADGRAHPDKQTVAKLLKWYGEVTVVSHTDWWSHGFFVSEDALARKHLSLKVRGRLEW